MTTNEELTTKVVISNDIQLCSSQQFLFKIIYASRIHFEVVTFRVRSFEQSSDGQTTNTTIVDIKNIYNFVVHNFLFKIIYPSHFVIQNFHMAQDGEITTKVAELDEM